MANTAVSSLVNVRFYSPDDDYHYTTDNRPLTDLATNDAMLASMIDGILSVTSYSVTASAPTSGTVNMTMPLQGGGKQVILTFNAYENDTTAAQTLSFPTAFTATPLILGNNSGLTLTVSTLGVTISAPDNVMAYSGTAVITGN